MAEKIRQDDEPRILDVEDAGNGNSLLKFEGANARDIFATLHFHEPNEEKAKRKILYLFDQAVLRGMLRKSTLAINDPADNQELEGVKFTRTMKFGEGITPEQVRNAFLAVNDQDEESTYDMVTRVFSSFIDAGKVPLNGILLTSHN